MKAQYSTVEVKFGSKLFNVLIDQDDHTENEDDTENEESVIACSLTEQHQQAIKNNRIKTLGELREYIAETTNSDSTTLKLIHKGKFLKGENAEMLTQYKFSSHDKLIAIGTLQKQDLGISTLISYEKKHLSQFSQQLERISKDVTELEKNFLNGAVLSEMISKMEKEMARFNDAGTKHMEAIDSLVIYNETTSDEQRKRNREKRKSMIDTLDDLLNTNDKFIFRLKQYRFSVEHPDEGH